MRHTAREIAFHMLFASEYRPDEFRHATEQVMEEYFALHKKIDIRNRRFLDHLVRGVLAEQDSLDAAIVAAGSNWKLSRIGRIERAILRLAVFEILHPDQHGEQIPVEIVIDEAVELAKIYGPDEAPAFVNGVLDAVARRAKEALGAEAP